MPQRLRQKFVFVVGDFKRPQKSHALDGNDVQQPGCDLTSSVVAAGYSFSSAAGDLAVIVKLTRTLMIVPITMVLAVYTSRKTAVKGDYKLTKIFPWFVLGFLAASVLNTFLPIPAGVCAFLSQAGKFIIVMAMVSIGLNTHLVKLIKTGVSRYCWVSPVGRHWQ